MFTSRNINKRDKKLALVKLKELETNRSQFKQTRDYCQAAYPSHQSKKFTWNLLFDRNLFSNADKKTIEVLCFGWRQRSQKNLIKDYNHRFFEEIGDVINSLPEDIAWIYFCNLAPTMLASFEEIDAFEKYVVASRQSG